MILSGKVWKVGDDVGATDLVSPAYDKLGMSHKWSECAPHVLEESRPGLAASLSRGDILVAGGNFGAGHAHYYMTAIMACKSLGLSGMFADSAGGLFQRAGIDQGMPVWAFPGISSLVEEGDMLELDLRAGTARNLTSGRSQQFKPVSPVILDILDADGSTNWALRRVGKVAA